MYKQINTETPVAMLTLGQLTEFLDSHFGSHKEKEVSSDPKRYVRGLKGIAELFGVSHVTAQRYKDTIIKDAVYQSGRTIVVDVDKALELFKANREG